MAGYLNSTFSSGDNEPWLVCLDLLKKLPRIIDKCLNGAEWVECYESNLCENTKRPTKINSVEKKEAFNVFGTSETIRFLFNY